MSRTNWVHDAFAKSIGNNENNLSHEEGIFEIYSEQGKYRFNMTYDELKNAINSGNLKLGQYKATNVSPSTVSSDYLYGIITAVAITSGNDIAVRFTSPSISNTGSLPNTSLVLYMRENGTIASSPST